VGRINIIKVLELIILSRPSRRPIKGDYKKGNKKGVNKNVSIKNERYLLLTKKFKPRINDVMATPATRPTQAMPASQTNTAIKVEG